MSQTLNFLALNFLKLFCLKWLAKSFPEFSNTMRYIDGSSEGGFYNAHFSCPCKVINPPLGLHKRLSNGFFQIPFVVT